jgi:cAMP-dependent protein kinase regulator
MRKEIISSKDAAERALSRGAWSEALEHFQEHCAQKPGDLRSRRKVAELLERLGRKEEAIQAYRKLAEAYAGDGFLLQAISINKIVQRVDPSLKDVDQKLTQLSAEKLREERQEAEPFRIFPRVPLFSDLDEQELQSLVSRVRFRTFQKDETICQEGASGDSLMVISRGEVGVFKQIDKGKETWLRNLNEGDFFGEFGFFTDQKRHATVKATTECEVLEISRNDLNEIIKAHPHVREVLENLFQKRVLDLFLTACPLFFSLSFPEREDIFKRFRLISVPGETLLFHGGEPPASLYLIRSGKVEIFLQKPKGERTVLGVLESGDFFGEIGPLFDKPRSASARTTVPSELLELRKEDLAACVFQFPQIQKTMKEISVRRLTRMNLEIFLQKRTEKVREALV